jgi:hypothetical protein
MNDINSELSAVASGMAPQSSTQPARSRRSRAGFRARRKPARRQMPRHKGEEHYAAKISEPQARLILSSRLGERGLARALGISRSQVSRIRHRVEWKCL